MNNVQNTYFDAVKEEICEIVKRNATWFFCTCAISLHAICFFSVATKWLYCLKKSSLPISSSFTTGYKIQLFIYPPPICLLVIHLMILDGFANISAFQQHEIVICVMGKTSLQFLCGGKNVSYKFWQKCTI